MSALLINKTLKGMVAHTTIHTHTIHCELQY
jgi:hypothetical protein